MNERKKFFNNGFLKKNVFWANRPFLARKWKILMSLDLF